MNNTSAGRRRRPHSTLEERAEWVRRFKQSGLSQREFAARSGLRLATLQRWILRQPRAVAKRRSSATGFTELRLPGLGGGQRWAVEIIGPDGGTLRLAADVSCVLVRQLLRAC